MSTITGGFLGTGLDSLNVTAPIGPMDGQSAAAINLSNYSGPFSSLFSINFLGQPLVWLLGLMVLLGLTKIFSEHPSSPISPAHIHIGGYNWWTITVASISGIVIMKLIFNRWPVPGITQLVNAA